MKQYLVNRATILCALLLLLAGLYLGAFYKLRRHQHITVLDGPMPATLSGWKGANYCWFSENQTANSICYYIFWPMMYGTGHPVEDMSLRDAVDTGGLIYVRKLDTLIAMDAMWQ
jgi:hypothetical protein